MLLVLTQTMTRSSLVSVPALRVHEFKKETNEATFLRPVC